MAQMNLHPAPSLGHTLRTRRCSPAIVRIVTVVFLATMLQSFLGLQTAAQDAQPGQITPPTIPANVLQASVRIKLNVKVTPDDENEAPFLCMIGEETVWERGLGSGTIISEDGYVLTNHHVIATERMPREVRNLCEDQVPGGKASADWIMVAWLPDEKGVPTDPYRIELVADTDLARDMALVQITEHLDGSPVDESFPFVQFGDSDALREPERIYLIGYPKNAGTNRRVSEGIFSGWGDNGWGEQWIYSDAVIAAGNSGGTAVNSQGLFIGIPSIGTYSDCDPGDTNNDGAFDENDTGCLPSGGTYSLLVPGNTAREFVEEELGEDFQGDARTPKDETPEVIDADGPPFGTIEFVGYDESGEPVDGFANISKLGGCFDNNWVEDGQEVMSAWYLNDEPVYEDNFRWDSAWDPTGCVWIFIEEGSDNPFLDAGEYRVELAVGDQTIVSDPITITQDTDAAAVTIVD